MRVILVLEEYDGMVDPKLSKEQWINIEDHVTNRFIASAQVKHIIVSSGEITVYNSNGDPVTV